MGIDMSPSSVTGELGEKQFELDCLNRNLVACKPSIPSISYDFILDTGDRLLKIQVKNTNNKCGKISLRRNKGKTTTGRVYKDNEVDVFVIYVYQGVFIIPFNIVSGKIGITVNKTNKYKDYFNNWDVIYGYTNENNT